MNKDLILKAFGGSEEDFYKAYPTEDAFKMAMGGSFNFPNSQYLMDNGGPYSDPNYDFSKGPQRSFKWPSFNTASQFDKFIKNDPNLSLYNQSDLEGLGLVRPQGINKAAVKRQNEKATPFLPAGQTAEGFGIFQDNTGQSFLNQQGEYIKFDEDPGVVLNNNKYGGKPCFECGGFKKHGGDKLPQGDSNETFLESKQNSFLKALTNNAQKALMQEAQQEVMQDLPALYNQMPTAKDGRTISDDDYKRYQEFKQWENYQKEQGRPKYNGMNYFPMNYRRTYEPSNKDYSTMKGLTEDAKLKGLDINYGPLARLMGKTGRRMFGPKSISYNFNDVNPATSQAPNVDLQNPDNPLYNPNYNPNYNSGSTEENNIQVIRDSRGDMNFGPKINPTPNPGFNWNSVMAYGGYLPEAQDGLGSLLAPKKNPSIFNPQGPSYSQTSFVGAEAPMDYRTAAFGEYNPTMEFDYGPDMVDKQVTLNRRNQIPGEEAANWILAGESWLTSQLNNRNQEDIDFTSNDVFAPAQGQRKGTHIVNQSTEANTLVPNKSGSPYLGKYGMTMEDGGMYIEDNEYELTEEEIAAIQAMGGQIEYLD